MQLHGDCDNGHTGGRVAEANAAPVQERQAWQGNMKTKKAGVLIVDVGRFVRMVTEQWYLREVHAHGTAFVQDDGLDAVVVLRLRVEAGSVSRMQTDAPSPEVFIGFYFTWLKC
jgi:hypothetical protein